MLGLLLIYFIGKRFYDLAGKHDKNQWGFAIFGVIAYYFGTFIAGILLAIYYEYYSSNYIEDMSDVALGLIALPFGLLSCVILYIVLEKQWQRKPSVSSNYDILDEEIPD